MQARREKKERKGKGSADGEGKAAGVQRDAGAQLEGPAGACEPCCGWVLAVPCQGTGATRPPALQGDTHAAAAAALATDFGSWSEAEVRAFLEQRGEDFDDCPDFAALVGSWVVCRGEGGLCSRARGPGWLNTALAALQLLQGGVGCLQQ